MKAKSATFSQIDTRVELMQIGQLTGDGEVSKQSFNPDSDDDS